ncbi:Zn-binding lipoprotein adcA-like protein [Staphylococcus aureus]|uniref:Zn-binding lipoprotein adcA-like protein n=1 Tax=Staphylococcus aureus TaxID=1280 RepID=A0A380EPE7_STAAU|nr:Zn-binding lipoprotein adcA-like protein [Staphylococcus aureus]
MKKKLGMLLLVPAVTLSLAACGMMMEKIKMAR